jgi:hemolysin activation/secretion protein
MPLIAGDRIKDAPAPDQLRLGGEGGLRGYPLNYQNGDNRVVLTLEERVYSDWYVFRLVRVGGAVFYDLGRAWGGVNQNTVNGGWLSDVGIGLRLALGPRVLHQGDARGHRHADQPRSRASSRSSSWSRP